MSVSKEIIEILACTKCKGSLIYTEHEGFVCEKCKLMYPVKDGIPDMLIEDAVSLNKPLA